MKLAACLALVAAIGLYLARRRPRMNSGLWNDEPQQYWGWERA